MTVWPKARVRDASTPCVAVMIDSPDKTGLEWHVVPQPPRRSFPSGDRVGRIRFVGWSQQSPDRS